MVELLGIASLISFDIAWKETESYFCGSLEPSPEKPNEEEWHILTC